MNTTQSNKQITTDLTLQGTLLDAVISLSLLAGAWATDWFGKYFYPAGVPFPYSTILFARDIATLLWVIGTTFRYFRYAYRELSLTLNSVAASKLWNRARKLWLTMSVSTKRTWGCLDVLSKKIVLMVCVVVLAFVVFVYSGGEFYFLFPIVYWGGAFVLSQILEWKYKKPQQSYWLMAFLFFLLILLSVFIIRPTLTVTPTVTPTLTLTPDATPTETVTPTPTPTTTLKILENILVKTLSDSIIGLNSLGNYVVGEMTLAQRELIVLLSMLLILLKLVSPQKVIIAKLSSMLKSEKIKIILSVFKKNRLSYCY